MAELLSNLSDSLAAVVETASPSVVRVEARGRLSASGIVWSADGVIVTAHHVVQQDENISVGLPDGKSVAAALVGRDPTTDLAVLRAQATGLRPPAWTEPGGLRAGHLVMALGRPRQGVLAALGIVSAIEEDWSTPAGGRLDHYLQTDVVMYPGFSGGPLVDVAGTVIGLNSSALLRGISLTVPVPTLRRVVDTLLAHGRMRRGYLGVRFQPVRLPEALQQQLGQETGLMLVFIEVGSPAEQGRLLLGDVILAVEGQPVRYRDNLMARLGGDQIGTSVALRLLRGGGVQEVTVRIGERT